MNLNLIRWRRCRRRDHRSVHASCLGRGDDVSATSRRRDAVDAAARGQFRDGVRSPQAIDFAAYKGKVDASLLALAEKEFKGVQYPPFAELDEAKAEYDAMFAEADQKIAESKTRIDELTKQMNVMVAKKVGHATTVDDVYEAYPDIEKEVDDEIDKHEWAKDAV